MDASHIFTALINEQPQGSSCFSQSDRDYAASAKRQPTRARRDATVTIPVH